MTKHILTVLVLLSLVGCATHQQKPIRYTDDGYAIPGSAKKVEVQAEHATPFKKDGTWYDIWYLRIANYDKNRDWCADIEWRTLDYSINVPNQWFHVPAYNYINIGSAVQRSWDIGNMSITMPDAGFAVYRVNLKKPINGKCND